MHHLFGVVRYQTINPSIYKPFGSGFVIATGPFADSVRRLDDPSLLPLLVGSVGSHILLDKSFTECGKGLLFPKTVDGRLLFMLPWQGSTLVGTTDVPTKIVRSPKPSEEEIEYLIAHLERSLGLHVERGAIQAAWSGIRPPVSNSPSISDVLYRRTHLAALDQKAALKVLPTVIDLMTGALGWNAERQHEKRSKSKEAIECVFL